MCTSCTGVTLYILLDSCRRNNSNLDQTQRGESNKDYLSLPLNFFKDECKKSTNINPSLYYM